MGRKRRGPSPRPVLSRLGPDCSSACSSIPVGEIFSPIEQDGHLLAVVRYVERNPVRAKMVERAEDYPWSSTRHHVRGSPDRLVTSSPIRGLVADWRQFLREEDSVEMVTIERHSRTGRPWGMEAWVRKLEKRKGRPLMPRKGGWPKGRVRKP